MGMGGMGMGMGGMGGYGGGMGMPGQEVSPVVSPRRRTRTESNVC